MLGFPKLWVQGNYRVNVLHFVLHNLRTHVNESIQENWPLLTSRYMRFVRKYLGHLGWSAVTLQQEIQLFVQY